MMDSALLDTDILSEVLKQRNANVAAKALAYLQQHCHFAMSRISRYEVRRGHLAKNALLALSRFGQFCSHNVLIAVGDAIVDRATDLWAIARNGGYPNGGASNSSWCSSPAIQPTSTGFRD